MGKRRQKIHLIWETIRRNGLPPVKTSVRVLWQYISGQTSLAVMAYTPYLRLPESLRLNEADSWMSFQEYIRRSVNLDDLSLRPLLMDKANLFERIGELMGRPSLRLDRATDEEIDGFLSNCGKIAGKSNQAAGAGFRIYSREKGDSVEIIRADAPDLLEAYIVQHPEYSRIYPDSVNTLRIHTVRNSTGVKVFFCPKLRVGAGGEVVDVGIENAYRVLLTDEGEIIGAFSHTDKRGGKDTPCDVHKDTGYRFEIGKKLPYVREAMDLCIRASEFYPEMRFIGWDVAITEDGPVIVEANDISGFWATYQREKARLTAIGSRAEAEEMFRFATEGVAYNEEEVFFSKPLEKWHSEFPTVRQLYLLYLQSALHRHGVEFFSRDYASGEEIPQRRDCDLTYYRESESVVLSIDGREETIALSPLKTIYSGQIDPESSAQALSPVQKTGLEQNAMHEAVRIYCRMILGCRKELSTEGLAAYARFCTRLHTVYFWSAMGQRLDKELIEWVEQKYPGHYNRKKLNKYASLIGGNIYAFDCSGLIKSYYFGGPGAPEYDESRDMNSEMMLERASRKGNIQTLPEEPGLCLHRPGHVGVYLGAGIVVDASPRHGELGAVKADSIEAVDWQAWFECPF